MNEEFNRGTLRSAGMAKQIEREKTTRIVSVLESLVAEVTSLKEQISVLTATVEALQAKKVK